MKPSRTVTASGDHAARYCQTCRYHRGKLPCEATSISGTCHIWQAVDSPFAEDLDEGLTIWVVCGHRHKGTMVRVPQSGNKPTGLLADHSYVRSRLAWPPFPLPRPPKPVPPNVRSSDFGPEAGRVTLYGSCLLWYLGLAKAWQPTVTRKLTLRRLLWQVLVCVSSMNEIAVDSDAHMAFEVHHWSGTYCSADAAAAAAILAVHVLQLLEGACIWDAPRSSLHRGLHSS